MVPKWLTPTVVAVVAGISVWLLSEQAPKNSQLTSKDNAVPDTYMEEFKTTIMGQGGKPRYELHASYMAHFPYDNYSEFTSPQFIYYRPDESQWVMSAERGTAIDSNKQIILQGNVTMFHRQLAMGDSALKITTSELLVRPDDSYAETDQLITIISGEHSLQSTGMKAYFNDGRVEFLSRVRGKYVL
ncbi:MAG: LPS export ABC transporter periplasmic protein LptC [Gammaproteobacteria bacterium]